MSERKPEGMRFESWVEHQIREAQRRGAFDNLPGAGRPLPGLTGNYDDMWWIKQLVQRERLSLVPPMLALRKEAEELLEGLADVPHEGRSTRPCQRLQREGDRGDPPTPSRPGARDRSPPRC